MLRSHTLQEWGTLLNVDIQGDVDWPAELTDLPQDLHRISSLIAERQPSLMLATLFELHVWLGYYAPIYIPATPLLFYKIWFVLLEQKYSVAHWLCRPLHELLVLRQFTTFIGEHSQRRFHRAPPPDYDDWDCVFQKINPAIAAHVLSLFN
jgi:hypothetical protein